MNLTELLCSILILTILASLLATATLKTLSYSRKTLKRIELKHNQDIMAAIDEGTTYIELNGKLYFVGTGP